MAPPVRMLALASGDEGPLFGFIRKAGLEPVTVLTKEEALARLDRDVFDIAVAALPTSEMLAFIEATRSPDVPIVAVVDQNDTRGRDDALRLGAAEVIQRPIQEAPVRAALDSLLERAHLSAQLPSPVAVPAKQMLGESPPVQQLRELVDRAAPRESTVLIVGETGTGKEIVAQELHEKSRRKRGPLVAVNLAGLPEKLLESELFGYEKGAFTGAEMRKPGRVELAEDGTLFLDEVGEIPLAVQVKLLRLLQQHEYVPLGYNKQKAKKANVRVVGATHRDLKKMVDEGTFREDLYYRLHVIVLTVPPLRSRRQDIPELARSYARSLAERDQVTSVELDDTAVKALQEPDWPGNVRQLLNHVERLVVLADHSPLTADDVRRELRDQGSFVSPPEGSLGAGTARTSTSAPSTSTAYSSVHPWAEEIAKAQKHALEKALAESKGNRRRAARLIGLGVSQFYANLRKHGMV